MNGANALITLLWHTLERPLKRPIISTSKRPIGIDMATRILAEFATSITELKANPMKAVASGQGMPIAVLNRNEPAFYCVPAAAYEQLLDKMEDLELLALANKREGDVSVKVNVDDL